MPKITATRYHDFSAGHRVHGHESKCAHLHGHNYRVFFTIQAVEKSEALDSIGRVIDFSAIKEFLCEWLEEEWDHKFLVSVNDPMAAYLSEIDKEGTVVVPFNPTAENMARYLVETIAPKVLPSDVELIQCTIEETRKCGATYTKGEK